MTDRPILFAGPMVRAILDRRKTQTRRVAKWAHQAEVDGFTAEFITDPGNRSACPYGVPGDRLYVREEILRVGEPVGPERWCSSIYGADGSPTKADAWPWQRPMLPAMHCPKGLSRITLEVTSVRIERLQDIAEEDAIAEGFDSVAEFFALWRKLNDKRPGCALDDNPRVWAIGFEVAS